MSRFQLIFTGILVALGVGGAILFAMSKNNANQGAVPTVMWGTVSSQLMNNFLSQANADNRDLLAVSYIQKNSATFEADLIAALARGAGPDMVLLPQDLVIKQLDKFYVVPFSSYSERIFKNAFIEQGELYLMPSSQNFAGGIIGFPFSIDPMVMYWNRDMFASAGVAIPPTSWTQILDLAPKLTTRDVNGNIIQSLIAFGEARNVSHFKDIIALLSLQVGKGIPSEEALSYYVEFSNPTKISYSWNRSLPTDRNAFAAGKLALYFGYASELAGIRNANPNLNFDVAPLPQAGTGAGTKKAAFGDMNAVAILKASKNIPSAYLAATTLTSAPLVQAWATVSGLPPVRRDLLSMLPGDAYQAVAYQSALISNGWLDPNREATNDVFGRLVENVTSGRLRVSESVRAAGQELQVLFNAANSGAN